MAKIIITEAQTKRLISELFSQKLVQELIDRFKEENPDLEDNVINSYIDRFQQIKDSAKIQQKDITKYSWNDLEALIINNQPKPSTKNVNKEKDIVYNQNGLEVL